jgi:hypothetical protein
MWRSPVSEVVMPDLDEEGVVGMVGMAVVDV